MSHATDIIIKGTMVGEFNVGKSSILQRYIGDTLRPNPTIGVDFNTKTHVVDGFHVKMHIWDTAGQERFRSIIKSYIRNVYVFFLVFDVTRRESYANLPQWVSFITHNSSGQHIIVLIANKTDAPCSEWKVTRDEVQQYAQTEQFGTVFFVSATENTLRTLATPLRHSIHQMFDIVVNRICKSIPHQKARTCTNGIIDRRSVSVGDTHELRTPPGEPPSSPVSTDEKSRMTNPLGVRVHPQLMTSHDCMTSFGFNQHYKTERCEPFKRVYTCC